MLKMSARSGWPLSSKLFVGEIGNGNFLVERDEALDLAASRPQHLHQRREIVFKQQHPRAGMIQDIGELQLGQADVERHHDSARLHHAVIAFQQLMIVEAQVGDAIAVLDAFFGQTQWPIVRTGYRIRRR